MGKKKKRERKQKKEDIMFINQEKMNVEFDNVLMNMNAKSRSKISKKMRKKARKEILKGQKQNFKEDLKMTGWHQVTVKVNMHVDKAFILNSIGSYVDNEFVALGFHKIGTNIYFYFESNKDIAESIRGLDRRIQSPDGEAMRINVNALEVPELVLNSNQLQVLREVIAKRYDPSLCLLDLTRLHMDETLLEMDIFAPLNNPLIMKQVLRIIRENISTLKALNLSNNKLDNGSLKLLDNLHSNASTLTALNLQDNHLSSLQFLKFINMFPLQELQFSSNPIQKLIKNPDQYLKMMKKELPSLKMIDGVDINSFSLKEPQLHRASTSHNLAADSNFLTEDHVRTFLEQYYKYIDTADRPNLSVAYTPTAKITLHSLNPAILSKVYNGMEEIKHFLASFPETRHVHDSFNLEMLNISSSEGSAKVTGLIHISGLSNPTNFERIMKIIPYNTGFCCNNDSLIIR